MKCLPQCFLVSAMWLHLPEARVCVQGIKDDWTCGIIDSVLGVRFLRVRSPRPPEFFFEVFEFFKIFKKKKHQKMKKNKGKIMIK